jgi:hypothetical protein
MVVVVVGFLPLAAQGQTLNGPVTLNASVSDTVALSISPNSIPNKVHIAPQGGPNAFTMVLSGSGSNVVTFRVPVLIRSNISYLVSTLVQSQAVSSANFAVLDARPSGRFVAHDAVASLEVARDFMRPPTSQSFQTASLPLSVSSPLPILSGPRVSLSGNLNSPENALEITFLISVKPDAAAGNWLLRLTLLGSAGRRFK